MKSRHNRKDSRIIAGILHIHISSLLQMQDRLFSLQDLGNSIASFPRQWPEHWDMCGYHPVSKCIAKYSSNPKHLPDGSDPITVFNGLPLVQVREYFMSRHLFFFFCSLNSHRALAGTVKSTEMSSQWGSEVHCLINHPVDLLISNGICLYQRR